MVMPFFLVLFSLWSVGIVFMIVVEVEGGMLLRLGWKAIRKDKIFVDIFNLLVIAPILLPLYIPARLVLGMINKLVRWLDAITYRLLRKYF